MRTNIVSHTFSHLSIYKRTHFLLPTLMHIIVTPKQEFIAARDNLERQRRVEMKKTQREKEQKERQRVKDKDAPAVEPKRS